MPEDVTITHDPDRSRYEAVLDGRLAGFAEYELGEGVITFTHTVVDDELEGRGVGSALAREALDDVRRRGDLRVVPQCAFIRAWIDKHPDHADLVEG